MKTKRPAESPFEYQTKNWKIRKVHKIGLLEPQLVTKKSSTILYQMILQLTTIGNCCKTSLLNIELKQPLRGTFARRHEKVVKENTVVDVSSQRRYETFLFGAGLDVGRYSLHRVTWSEKWSKAASDHKTFNYCSFRIFGNGKWPWTYRRNFSIMTQTVFRNLVVEGFPSYGTVRAEFPVSVAFMEMDSGRW